MNTSKTIREKIDDLLCNAYGLSVDEQKEAAAYIIDRIAEEAEGMKIKKSSSDMSLWRKGYNFALDVLIERLYEN